MPVWKVGCPVPVFPVHDIECRFIYQSENSGFRQYILQDSFINQKIQDFDSIFFRILVERRYVAAVECLYRCFL